MGSRQSARFGADRHTPFVPRDRVRETFGVSLKPNPVHMIDGAIDELLAAHDPSTTPHLEFRGARAHRGSEEPPEARPRQPYITGHQG